ncbi:MAG: acylphosphatase [Clostridia bacterium]|nr:acylphosphatase [Clostridia bacterium]
MEGTQARWRIIFSGKVQHVGFRYTAYYLAKELYLTGWVRNLPDGRVLLEAQGGVSRIRKLVLQLKSQSHIHIEHTQIEEIPLLPHDRGFKVISGM